MLGIGLLVTTLLTKTSSNFDERVKIKKKSLRGNIKSIQTKSVSEIIDTASVQKHDIKMNLIQTFDNLTRNIYYYNQHNLIKECKQFSKQKENYVLMNTGIWEYENFERLKKIQWYYYDGSISNSVSFMYDQSNKICKKTQFKADGNIFLISEYRYDKSGNKISTVAYSPDRKVEQIKIFLYDYHNNLTEETHYNKDICISKTTHKYDEHNNIIESITYKPNGMLDKITFHKYKYDIIGKWIYENIIVDNKQIKITERKIEYNWPYCLISSFSEL